MDLSVQVHGLAEVQRRLVEAPSLLVARAFYKALDMAAGVIAAEVELRAPDTGEGLLRDEGQGLLKDNVIVRVHVEPGEKGGSAAVGFAPTQSERTGKPADLIALWVEFGHIQTTHEKQPVGIVPPHPFMRRAAESAGNRAIKVFGDTLLANLSVIES